jgi:hypothetical protein
MGFPVKYVVGLLICELTLTNGRFDWTQYGATPLSSPFAPGWIGVAETEQNGGQRWKWKEKRG